LSFFLWKFGNLIKILIFQKIKKIKIISTKEEDEDEDEDEGRRIEDLVYVFEKE